MAIIYTAADATNSVSLTDVNYLNDDVDDIENEINDMYNDASIDWDESQNVLQMQQLMNEWSYLIGMTSTIAKTLSDAYKSITQKI